MKSAAAVAALAALGLVAVNYSSSEGSQLFLSERISAEEMEYMKYVTEWGKSYGTKAEFEFRLEQFKKTMAKMAEHNSINAHGSTVTHNQFSDYTEAEYKKLLGYKPYNRVESPEVLDDSNLADSVNWVTKGAVTPVKNQGQCGSCWSFSTTGSVQGAMFLSTGKLQSFSEQQLVDCSGSFGNMGCNGGLMDNAFKYIEKNPLELESDYAYTARDGKCQYDSSKGQGQVAAYTDVQHNSADQLKAALNQQPVSIAIEADQSAFQYYTSGVITKGCGQQLDHGVLAVGYGTLNNEEYFLVKNSWGASWGDKGYVRISASSKNVCGILSDPSFPTE